MRFAKILTMALMAFFVVSLVNPVELPARGQKKTSSKESEVIKEEAKAQDSSAGEGESTGASDEAGNAEDAKDAEDDGTKKEQTQTEVVKGHRKSTGTATLMATFPGFVVRGAGHMYAGSWVKGLGLLAVQVATSLLIVDQVDILRSEIDSFDSLGDNKVPTNYSRTFSSAGIILVAGLANLFSWFDDIGGAPIAVEKYNERMAERESQAKIQLMPTQDLAGLSLGIVKRF